MTKKKDQIDNKIIKCMKKCRTGLQEESSVKSLCILIYVIPVV